MSVADDERLKYERVWASPEYRKVSPGEIEQDRPLRSLGLAAGSSLNDYGAGTGRATAWFAKSGVDVLAVDHAENALEVSVPFVRACLWDMPDVRVSDFGYCCDVMEHIPPEYVDSVLSSIAERTRVAV